VLTDAAAALYAGRLAEIRTAGLEKSELAISSPQGARIEAGGRPLLNLCANNYLGLSNHPVVVAAADAALAQWGFGLSSVRFICGTQDLHTRLERRLADWLGVDDAILFSSCFDANGGLFETLLDEPDAVVSDQLNHASIIDGIRLCKARRLRYRNRDLADLDVQLASAADARLRLIASDGVFSMDGTFADLSGIAALARRHGALLMVDDSHAVGFVGPQGRGTAAAQGVAAEVDLLTGTFGKALGGASGGYIAGRAPLIALLRQRARPYLFSNSLAPCIVAATLAAIDLVGRDEALRARVHANAAVFRAALVRHGFKPGGDGHPIIPVLLGDARLAVRMAAGLQRRGIHAVAFSFPVVPQGAARIRCQVSAAHDPTDLEWAAGQFAAARDEAQAAS
jgi:glycine C-acetyltransferase